MRLAVAKHEGLDEATIADADAGGETLDAAQRAAVALAQDMMSRPADISSALGEDLHQHFSDDQLLELTLDVMKWSYQKVSVALGTDAEVAPHRLTELRFDADGNLNR
ncbi:MAG: hypothetical protein ACR2HP_17220 [Ilumatobacteraceae bacterium]